MVDKQADLEAQDEHGNTALISAVLCGNLEIIRLLLDAGVETDTEDNDDKTPLMHAAQGDELEIARLLLDAGAYVDAATNETIESSLHYSAQNGNLEMVQLLLDAGAEADADWYIKTPLHYAVEEGHLEVCKLLVLNTLVQNYDAERPIFFDHNTTEVSNYWDQCKTEIRTIKEYDLGEIRGMHVSLYDFFTEQSDVRLVSYLRNKDILSKLDAVEYNEFPIFADLLQNKIIEGQKKVTIHNAIENKIYISPGDGTHLSQDLSEVVNKNINKCLGSHDTRKNLVRAALIDEQQPSGSVKQSEVAELRHRNLGS